MRLAAFKLVATVIGIQLALIFFILAGCLFTRDERCNGSQAAELLTAITAQSFALYAAEK